MTVTFGSPLNADTLDCGHARPHSTPAFEGYVMTPHGQLVCPACKDAYSETVVGYLNLARGAVTTWQGVQLLKVTRIVRQRVQLIVYATHGETLYRGIGTGDREYIRLLREPRESPAI